MTQITEKNVRIIQFLDCLDSFENCADSAPELNFSVCNCNLNKYIEEHSITKADIEKYIGYFDNPDKIYRAMNILEVDYVLT